MKYTFTYQTNDPAVQTVHVAGSFNEWLKNHSDYKMKKIASDSNTAIYELTIDLPPGKHEFKYVINGEKWENDKNLEKTNDHNENSLINISADDTNTSSSLASSNIKKHKDSSLISDDDNNNSNTPNQSNRSNQAQSNSGQKKEKKPQGTAVQHESGQDRLQRYEANEHKEIGNQAFKVFFDKNQELKQELAQVNPETYYIELTDAVQLAAGEWVALAGDFYAVPDRPISGLPQETIDFEESKRRFIAAYESLANIRTPKEISELEALRDAIEIEEGVVKETVQNGGNIPRALHEHAKTSNSKFAQITANNILTKFLAFHLPIAIVGLTVYTRYLEIAANNYDHFGKDAETAYAAGHAVACQTAEEAHQKLQEGKNEEAKPLLIRALTQELFACHFLTDLFASGHLRVPRKELCRQVGNTKIAGALSLMMHNEDGDQGLVVHQRGNKMKTWPAKGDGCLYDADAEENHQRAINAVASALQFIYETYRDPAQANKFDFRDHIPVYDPALNSDPLFVAMDERTVARRHDLSATTVKATPKKDWHAIPTLVKLWFINKDHLPDDDKHRTAEEFEKAVEAELNAVESEGNQEMARSKHCTII